MDKEHVGNVLHICQASSSSHCKCSFIGRNFQKKWKEFWSAWASLQGKCDCFSETTHSQGANEGVQPPFTLVHMFSE